MTDNTETFWSRARALPMSPNAWLAMILLAGLAVRLLFIVSEGFATDTNDFADWAVALAAHRFASFYQYTSFADYPPGYLYVLWAVGKLHALAAPHGNGEVLKCLVKAPAISMDLANGAVLFALVRRFSNDRWAFVASAAYTFNPAVIFISATWGQVDSVALAFVLIGVFMLLRSADADHRRTPNVVASFAALSCSILIKPQAAVLAPLFIAFVLCAKVGVASRVSATACAVAAAVAAAFFIALPFHPSANPLKVLTWLYQHYEVGKNAYPYNSVNAFNLWSVVHPFWQTDSQPIGFLPQYDWGVLLLVSAAVIVLVRYCQAKTERAFIEAASVLGLAFFMFSTRMHERYIYDGLAFTICSIPFARRYAVSSAILSVTLFLNLLYSLRYLAVVTHGVPGVDSADIWGWFDHILSLVNVAAFFWLGYAYVGAASEETARGPAAPWTGWAKARSWFDPTEGTIGLRWPLDYVVSAALSGTSFVILYVRFWFPPDKIFDEVYFARAAEEYLHTQYIYENTHPPVTKLLITLSTLAFGDNAYGWRFLDVLFGALAVCLLFALLKRVTGSTLFSAYGAGLFMLDGMHFVQSRIATPESFVVVFALAALYTFYRYWIASQVAVERVSATGTLPNRALGTASCLLVAAAFTAARFPHESVPAKWAAGVCAFAGLYLVYRLVIEPRIGAKQMLTLFPDGTTVCRSEDGTFVKTSDGGTITPRLCTPGDLSRVRSGRLDLEYDGLRIAYKRTGDMSYASPAGTVAYRPSVHAKSNSGLWLGLFAVSIALLVASKWYGVMSCGVAFTIIVGAWFQPRFATLRHRFTAAPRKPALWGNPYGFRLDVCLAVVAFVVGTVYFAAYTPQFVGLSDSPGAAPRPYSLTDVVNMQYAAFEYHDHLVATHPYQSKWWQWPLDLRPILYYAKYGRSGSVPTAAMIYTLPNPLIMWLGLLTVPLVGYMGFRERNKGYVLIVLTYVAQWLPWMGSPRISFAYHFYVDIPLICACSAITMQRLWQRCRASECASLGVWLIGGYFSAVALAFVYFYPILSGITIPSASWIHRTWLQSWM